MTSPIPNGAPAALDGSQRLGSALVPPSIVDRYIIAAVKET
jgi:hypothetical protein